jgi:hypothetical protein
MRLREMLEILVSAPRQLSPLSTVPERRDMAEAAARLSRVSDELKSVIASPYLDAALTNMETSLRTIKKGR